MIKRKIAILTQPLLFNYGGLLQAFALQKVLSGMGHDVFTDRHQRYMPFYHQLLSSIKRALLKYICRRKDIETAFPCFYTKDTYPVIGIETEKFIAQHINTIDLFQGNSAPSKDMVNYFDAFIVGSDQVWRPKYSSCLSSYFLDFTKDQDCKRISYAASFGVSDWELTKKQTILCQRLIKQFDLVSVREDSAVSLCKSHFDVDAIHVLDPTLLLDQEDYISLVEQEQEPVSSGNLMAYILDSNDDKLLILDRVAKACGLDSFEDVVTDSFHGSAFAIIFNKPFIAIGNKKRGLTRFDSLLRFFSLEDRLVYFSSDLSIEQIKAPINFERVNALRNNARMKAVDLLKSVL